MQFPEYPASELTYLPRSEVVRCCAEVDVVAVVATTLRQHAAGETLLPHEAYLGWATTGGADARSLAMPGGVGPPGERVVGLKLINASLGNTRQGMARSQGLVVLFDPETARPQVLMEAAYVSALRTAAVTAVSARALGVADLRSAAVIGCGTLARAHLMLLPAALPGLERVTLYDLDPARSSQLLDAAGEEPASRRLSLAVADCPRACVRDAELVVTATTTTTGYLAYEWLAPGALVAHVSLDDVLPEVVHRAGLLVVDDWSLVSHDHRRLLGRLYREGRLRAPDGSYHSEAVPDPAARRVDATLGEVLVGAHRGRRDQRQVVLSNPFGMAILDLTVAAQVARVAAHGGGAVRLPM